MTYDEDDCNLSLFLFFRYSFRWSDEMPNGRLQMIIVKMVNECGNWGFSARDARTRWEETVDYYFSIRLIVIVMRRARCVRCSYLFFLESKKHELPSNLSEFMQSLRLMDWCARRFCSTLTLAAKQSCILCAVRWNAATAVLDKTHTQHARWVNKSLWVWHGRHIAHRFIIKSEWHNDIETEMRTQRAIALFQTIRMRDGRNCNFLLISFLCGMFDGLMSLPVALIIVIHFTCAIDH